MLILASVMFLQLIVCDIRVYKLRCYIKTAAVLSMVAIMVLGLTGCNKEPKSKYTEEQLRNFPQPQIAGLPAPTGGLVLAVNSETISAEEIVSSAVVDFGAMAKQLSYEDFFEKSYSPIKQILTDRITNTLLYQKAKITVPESVFEEGGQLDKAVDTEMRRMLASYENNYALAQQEIEKSGFDWKSYREFQKKQILAQLYFVEKIERNPLITHKEIRDFYESRKEDEFKRQPKVSFLLIDILKGDDPEQAGETAKKVLDEIRGGKDFALCISEYSQGIKARTGGLWEATDLSSFNAPYNTIAESIESMSAGQVSDIIETDGHFFIAKVVENTRAGYLTFEAQQEDIEKYLKSVKRKEQMDKLLGELFDQADIMGLEGFLQYCIQQTYLRARSS